MILRLASGLPNQEAEVNELHEINRRTTRALMILCLLALEYGCISADDAMGWAIEHGYLLVEGDSIAVTSAGEAIVHRAIHEGITIQGVRVL